MPSHFGQRWTREVDGSNTALELWENELPNANRHKYGVRLRASSPFAFWITPSDASLPHRGYFRQQPRKIRLDRRVALAACGFQTFAVGNIDRAAIPVRDETNLRQSANDNRDRRAANTEHDC